ncbi:MAG: hypothetical protein QNJ05_06395 [Woeseiaceae bacterium]|nr:hypothetical protein [Woeseiaceae bacterium]
MPKSLRNLSLLAVAAVCTGCVSAEGISLGTQPYISPDFAEYAAHPDREATEAQTESDPRGVTELILIGNVSAFREFDEDDKTAEYEKYARAFEAWGIDQPPQLDAEAFAQTIRGWTKIKIVGVPLLLAAYIKALVPSETANDVEFESAVATFMLQTSSDLVAARTNADGAFVIDTLLCSDSRDRGYTNCAKRYHRGVYDADTGLRIKSKLKLDEDGPRIDPATYVLLDEDAGETDASMPSAE